MADPLDLGDSTTYGGFTTTLGTRKVNMPKKVLTQRGIPHVRKAKYKTVNELHTVQTKTQTPWSQTVNEYSADPNDPTKRIANEAYKTPYSMGATDAQGRTVSWVKPPPAPKVDIAKRMAGESGYLAATSAADTARSNSLNQLNYEQGQRKSAYDEVLRRFLMQRDNGIQNVDSQASKSGLLYSQGRNNLQSRYKETMDQQRGDFEAPYLTETGLNEKAAKAAEDQHFAAYRQAEEDAKNRLSQQDIQDAILGGSGGIKYQTPSVAYPQLENDPKSPYAGLSFKTIIEKGTGRKIKVYSNGQKVAI